MQYLLLLHGKTGYANAPQCYVYIHIVYLMYTYIYIRIHTHSYTAHFYSTGGVSIPLAVEYCKTYTAVSRIS